MRYFLELEFDGTNYHGWQTQPNAISVQEVLEHSLSKLLGREIAITGAGRTDAGVHATQMYAHFDVISNIDESHLKFRMNSFLPHDIAIRTIRQVKDEAHARFDAISRSYSYRLHHSRSAFLRNRSYYIHQKLNVELMNKAAKILLDYKDFECFSKTNTDVKTFICDVSSASWYPNNEGLEFKITADRFLRNMVRAIVGTLINVGLEKINLENVHEIIKSKNRSNAGYSVPGHGLYLTRVDYPDAIFLS